MRLVYIALGWTTGMVLVAAGAALDRTIWLALAALLTIIVTLVWHTPTYRLYNLILLAFVLGGLRYTFVPTSSDIARFNNSGGLTITGTIITPPDIRDDRADLRVEVSSVQRGGYTYTSSGIVLARVPRNTDVALGDIVSVTGALIAPGAFDTFSYADYLAQQNVFSIMTQSSVSIVTPATRFNPQRGLFDLRADLNAAIGRNLPEPQAGLLAGILLGNERGISPALDDAFRVTGASHVIAISGFNMAIIAALVMRLLSALTPRRGLRVAIGLFVIAVYTVFTGSNPAVIRAAIMSGVLIVGTDLFGRKTYVPASLAFVALFMSLINPPVIFSLSFQLSFFAVLGLALFADPFQRAFMHGLHRLYPTQWAQRIGGFLAEPLVVTLAAYATTLPIIVLYFERVSLVSLAVNLLIVPVQTYLLLIGGLATLLVLIVPPIAQILYWLDYVLLSWTIGVVRNGAAIPGAEAALRVDNALIYAYFSLMIGGAILMATQPAWWLRVTRFARSRIALTTALIMSVLLLVLMTLLILRRPDGDLHVWYLDAGHSHAVLIRTPKGAHMLVDGGNFPSRLLTQIGDTLPYNDRTLEVIALTSPDAFDTGALPAVLRRYDTGIVISNGQPNAGADYDQLQAALADHDVLTVTAGATLALDDGVTLEVLHPAQTPTLEDPLGAGPLVLRLTYGDVSFLLTSALNRNGQMTLLEGALWPQATVLTLPDHGAARSLDPAFIAAVQPSVVIVQADPANRRGDPNADTLALIPDTVPILRTDQSGAIHLWTDGASLWWE